MSFSHDTTYLSVAKELLAEFDANGTRENRTDIQAASIFGRQLRYDLSKGFPLLTTRKMKFANALHEIIWMLNGDTNIIYLNSHGINIWDQWADDKGDLGPVYGRNWRHWDTIDYDERLEVIIDTPLPDYLQAMGSKSHWTQIDQIAHALYQLRNDPFSRRIIISAWDPAVVQPPTLKIEPKELPQYGFAALPSCHTLFQFGVTRQPGTDRLKLNCMLYMRSNDYYLGNPTNIAGYALLTHLFAEVCDMDVGELVWTGADTHLYANCVEQMRQQVEREPRPSPKLILKNVPKDLYFPNGIGDMIVELEGYDPHPPLKRAAVAV